MEVQEVLDQWHRERNAELVRILFGEKNMSSRIVRRRPVEPIKCRQRGLYHTRDGRAVTITGTGFNFAFDESVIGVVHNSDGDRDDYNVWGKYGNYDPDGSTANLDLFELVDVPETQKKFTNYYATDFPILGKLHNTFEEAHAARRQHFYSELGQVVSFDVKPKVRARVLKVQEPGVEGHNPLQYPIES